MAFFALFGSSSDRQRAPLTAALRCLKWAACRKPDQSDHRSTPAGPLMLVFNRQLASASRL
jgi:hypothetical protein